MTLSVVNLNVTYVAASGQPVAALKDLSLEIENGEFVSIIGPSGCGKTTLLHIMGGLLRPSSGKIFIDGVGISKPDPRLAALVFQDYTLFPWKSILDNVGVGLRFQRLPKATWRARGEEMLSLVGLLDWKDAYPRELSGGMQQRVAVARALCMDPRTMLMDEPFAALDEQTRRSLGFEMSALLTERERTVVMVTHSLDEAILWADRILVLSSRPGRVIKEIVVGAPRPRTTGYVASPEFGAIRAELYSQLESFAAPGHGAVATKAKAG